MKAPGKFTTRTLTAALVCIAGTAQAQMVGEAAGAPAPNTFFHATALSLTTTGCTPIATPPAGKALVVTEVRVNIRQITPGTDEYFSLIIKPTNGPCLTSGLVSLVSPSGRGQIVIPFNPGLGIAAGQTLTVAVNGNTIEGQAFTDGYTVTTKTVPQPPADRGQAPSSLRSPEQP
jgi:hypothetical protein